MPTIRGSARKERACQRIPYRKSDQESYSAVRISPLRRSQYRNSFRKAVQAAAT